jgi:hypothetical protein
MIIGVHRHLSTLDEWGSVVQQALSRAQGSRAIDLLLSPNYHANAVARSTRQSLICEYGIVSPLVHTAWPAISSAWASCYCGQH